MDTLIKEKAEQASMLLVEFGFDVWITFVRETEINGDPSLDLILGSDLTWHSALIFHASGKRIAVVGKFDTDTVKDSGIYDEVIGYTEGIEGPLAKVLRDLDPKSVAVNYSIASEVCDGIQHGMFLHLEQMLSGIGLADRIVSAEPLISALRQRKSPTEIQRIRTAVDITERIFDEIPGYVRPGVTEVDIARIMKRRAADAQCEMAWTPSTCPAVFTGPDTADAHYAPTDREVRTGHIIHIDFGVRKNGYCSDLQRGFYVLEPDESQPPDVVQRAYDVVFRAIEKSAQALKPGLRGIEIDAIARQEVLDAGFEEFACALGHQVGRYAHDGTALLGPEWEKYSTKSTQMIEPGMVFTLEPHVKVPGYGMASIEEMVLVTDTGCEFLSRQQQEVYLIHLH